MSRVFANRAIGLMSTVFANLDIGLMSRVFANRAIGVMISAHYPGHWSNEQSVRQPGHGLMSRECTNGSGDRGLIPDRVIPKTQKMVLDATLLNTQHYKESIKGKVEQSREWSSALPYTSV